VVPPAQPLPPVVQNIAYTTNVYLPPVLPPAAPSPMPAAAPEAPPATPSSGFATCDAYFLETERCARAVTSSPAAIADLKRTLDVARGEDRIIAASDAASAKSEISTRCEVALRAYDYAPCVRR
jgi:hypothetical protein